MEIGEHLPSAEHPVVTLVRVGKIRALSRRQLVVEVAVRLYQRWCQFRSNSDDQGVVIDPHQTSLGQGDGFDHDALSMYSKPQPYPLG